MRILISGSANYMNSTNMFTASKLLGRKHVRSRGKAGGKLSVFLTDYMLHAKLIMSEKRILTGSCNINRKSFSRLGELCVTANNDDNPFACQVRASVEELFSNSAQVDCRSDIRFNPCMTAVELAIMR